MRNIFIPGLDLNREVVTISGPDFHHLAHVLRAQSGERFVVLDDKGGAANAEIVTVEKREMVVRLVGPAAVPPEPAVMVTVAQALSKGDRFEQALQHSTEAGASAFIPLVTERTVARVEGRSAEDKLARWRLVVKGAAEQSGRARIPPVHPIATLPELLSVRNQYTQTHILHADGQQTAFEGVSNGNLLLIVGPEGGFTSGEIELARQSGVSVTSLGPYVLRTETAPVVALAQILFAAGHTP